MTAALAAHRVRQCKTLSVSITARPCRMALLFIYFCIKSFLGSSLQLWQNSHFSKDVPHHYKFITRATAAVVRGCIFENKHLEC